MECGFVYDWKHGKWRIAYLLHTGWIFYSPVFLVSSREGVYYRDSVGLLTCAILALPVASTL